jgi:hypothetical protein
MNFGIRAQAATANTMITSAQNMIFGHARLKMPKTTCGTDGFPIKDRLFMAPLHSFIQRQVRVVALKTTTHFIPGSSMFIPDPL